MEITPIRSSSARRTIAVAICTYQRNEALTNLLEALLISAAHVAGLAAVGVVIVDDFSDGQARSVFGAVRRPVRTWDHLPHLRTPKYLPGSQYGDRDGHGYGRMDRHH